MKCKVVRNLGAYPLSLVAFPYPAITGHRETTRLTSQDGTLAKARTRFTVHPLN